MRVPRPALNAVPYALRLPFQERYKVRIQITSWLPGDYYIQQWRNQFLSFARLDIWKRRE